MKNKITATPPAPNEFWDERFAQEEYVYGKEPNRFFKTQIDTLKAGKIFIAGAGEGRDAVYAAQKGWEVTCVDLSKYGKIKASKLAAEKNVKIKYEITDIDTADYPTASFDVVASIFFHLPDESRRRFYKNVFKWLKTGGLLIMQGFTEKQLQNTSGGPKEKSMLLTTDKLRAELPNVKIISMNEQDLVLDEGMYHQGMASVISLVAENSSEQA